MGFWTTLFALETHGALQRGRVRAHRAQRWERIWHPTRTWIPAALGAALLCSPLLAVNRTVAGVAFYILWPVMLVVLVYAPDRK